MIGIYNGDRRDDFNDFKVLDNKGKISHKEAEQKIFDEYDEFNKIQKIESDFDREIKKLTTKNTNNTKV